MQKRKRNAPNAPKSASQLLIKQQPKPDTAKRLSHHHHAEEEDICPVCDSECNCANAASTIAQPSQPTSSSGASASLGIFGLETPVVAPASRYIDTSAVSSTTRNKKSSNAPIKRTKLTRQPVSRRSTRGPVSHVDEHELSSVSSSDIEEVVLLSKGAVVRKQPPQSDRAKGGVVVVMPDSDFSFGDSSSLSDTGSSSSSESSDESAMFSQDDDDDDSEALKLEEIQIRMNGMDSDEESNVGSSSDDEFHEPPPIEDPNDMEHIWSTDDDHFNLVDLPDDTLYIIEAQELQQQEQQHAHRSRNECKKKSTKSIDSPSSLSSPSAANSSAYSLSPEVIQNYLASRGIKIAMDRAVQFAKSLPCSTTIGSDLSALEKSAKLSSEATSTLTPPPTPPNSATSSIPATVTPATPSTLLSSRNSNLDPKLMTKEAKRFEALQAQAYGGMGFHNSNSSHLFKERRRSKRATDSDLPLVNIEDVVDISSYNNDDNEAQPEESDSNNLNSEQEHGSNSGSASEKSKFLRVPVGTFRRSRRVSAPILKLSKAVKNTFGVIPRSIHETLLHPSYEMGIGPLVQKKQSDTKEMILREKKRREKLAKNLSRLSKFRLDDFVEGSEDSEACASSISCSCSECEDLPRQQPVQSGRRSRVSSLCFDDFSAFIHDPNHPPSACTSPTNLYLTLSPRMFPCEDFE